MDNKPANHGKKWDKEDIECIYDFASKNYSNPNILKVLAAKYGRTEGAILTVVRRIFRKKFILNRNISKLVHFTDARNLKSIQLHGLMTVDKLKEEKINYFYSDPTRYDYMTNATSLSISRRNEFLFEVYKKRHLDTQWIELEIDPTIIIKSKCYFYDTNAANSKFNNNREELQSIIAFQNMFSDLVTTTNGNQITRINQKIDETTCIQAEIMIVNTIPTNMITGIRKIDVY